jgi:hypothetical protein
MCPITLPSHIPKLQDPACAGPGDGFLREHFRSCLLVYILGGDIGEGYDANLIIEVMEELGMCGGDTPLEPVPDSEMWNFVIGKEL